VGADALRADALQAHAYRFSLEDPHTGERFGFTGFESLVEFLRLQLDGNLDGSAAHQSATFISKKGEDR
jgi:hypothetical protein